MSAQTFGSLSITVRFRVYRMLPFEPLNRGSNKEEEDLRVYNSSNYML